MSRWIAKPGRWLFVAALTLLVATAFAIGVPVYRTSMAISEIQRRGGWVFHRKGSPAWLRPSLGDDTIVLLDRIVGVNLSSTRIDDKDLKQVVGQLKRFKSLESLYLGRNRFSDAGLRELSRLRNLEVLDLSDNAITDAGLKHLTHCRKLRQLGLAGTKVTDRGLATLGGMLNLEHLDLDHTAVTDTGMPELKRLTRLKELSVSNCPVTEDGLAVLIESLPKLSTFDD